MTREEQIDWLCRLRADLNNGIIFTPWNKEFTEALTDVLDVLENNEEPFDGTVNIELSLDFWNAPYKAERGE